jgi:hypothetical protein
VTKLDRLARSLPDARAIRPSEPARTAAHIQDLQVGRDLGRLEPLQRLVERPVAGERTRTRVVGQRLGELEAVEPFQPWPARADMPAGYLGS